MEVIGEQLIDPDLFIPAALLDLESEEERAAWQIKSLSHADWALRKRDFYLRRIQANMEAADEEIARLIAWRETVNDRNIDQINFFEGKLRGWHQSMIEADPGDPKAWKHEENKTIALPSGGKLSLAKNPASVEIHEETFIPWAIDNRPEWLNVERKVVRKPIKKDIKAALLASQGTDLDTGELVPGATVTNDDLRWEAVSA